MKSRIYALMLIVTIMFTFGGMVLAAPTSPADLPDRKTAELTEAEIEARLEMMRARVAEIRAMDKSELTRAERRALKKELREMNQQARSWGSGGVYLSVGAIIVIILLLILIL